MIDAVGRFIDSDAKYKRIVSLVPSQTEYLIDLLHGSSDQSIVGRTKFCIHPMEQVKDITIIGGTKQVHIDRIEALNPDLIIANKEENTLEIVKSLEYLCPVYTTEVKTVGDAYQSMADLGILLDQVVKTTKLIDQIKKEHNTYSGSTNNKSALYLIWNDPYMTIGGDTFITSMMNAAGFDNVYCHKERYPTITIEQIKKADPDYIFLSSEPFPFKEKHKVAFADLNIPVHIVDGELFSWYGTRMLRSWKYFKELKESIS